MRKQLPYRLWHVRLLEGTAASSRSLAVHWSCEFYFPDLPLGGVFWSVFFLRLGLRAETLFFLGDKWFPAGFLLCLPLTDCMWESAGMLSRCSALSPAFLGGCWVSWVRGSTSLGAPR